MVMGLDSFQLNILKRIKDLEKEQERSKVIEYPAGGGGGAHALLSATHTDTVAATPPGRGSLVVGSAANLWAEFPLAGFGGYILTRTPTDPAWSNTIQISGDARIGLIIKANSPTQSAHLQEWQISTGAIKILVTETANLEVVNTTFADKCGIIYKNAELWCHDFNYGNNGAVTTVGYNTFLGTEAGNLTSGATAIAANESSYNTGIGHRALYVNTTGYRDTALGCFAMRYNTGGYRNVAVGSYALLASSTGNYNVGIGDNAAISITNGSYNTFVGQEVAYNTTTGAHNTALGRHALYGNITGNTNIAIGNYSLFGATAPTYNIAIGYDAMTSLSSTGTYNIGIGRASCAKGLQHNVIVGHHAHINGYLGEYNCALGNYTLNQNVSGMLLIASGYESLYANVSGNYNTAYGAYTLRSNTAGHYNTAVGYEALYSAVPTGKVVTAFSDYSATVPGTVRATSAAHGLPPGITNGIEISGTGGLYDGVYSVTWIDVDHFYFTHAWAGATDGWWSYHVEGQSNTACGALSGRSITTGYGNTFLGDSAGYHASQLVNAIYSMALGYGAYTTADYQVVIGDANITATYLRGDITIGQGFAAHDYTLTIDGETNDGVITWMEDENWFALTGSLVVNETALDADTRMEGNSLTHMLFLDASAATENIALVTTAAPNWQTMDRGLFLGDASTVPTGNPVAGVFIYSEAGAGKCRGGGGTISTFGPSEPHCPVCGADYMLEWESDLYGYLAVCVNCLSIELGNRAWILREKARPHCS